MPQMGVSVSEGTVTRWLRNVGDTIAADEPLLEISTDKVDTEVPSPGAGVLQRDPRQRGRDGAGRDGRRADRRRQPARPPPRPEPPPRRSSRSRAARAAPEPEPGAAPSAPSRRREPEPAPRAGAGRRRARAGSPSAGRRKRQPASGHTLRLACRRADRRRARDRPDDGRPGTRPRRARDQEGHPRLRRAARAPSRCASRPSAAASRRLRYRPRLRPAPAAPAPPAPRRTACAPAAAPPAAPQPTVPSQPQPAAEPAVEPGESLEPMSAMRRGIAEHMRRSLDTAAHVTSAIEVDMSKVVAIRERLKGEYNVRLRRQPHLPRLHRARDRRDAARLAVRQRRDPRRVDPDPQLRQPRLRGRARGRQGPDRAGAEARRGAEPARDGPRHRRPRRARPHEEAAPRRRPGRHVHDHEPGQLRHLHRHAGDQPAADRRSSAPTPIVKRPWVITDDAGQRRDRDPADDEPDADLRPPPRRRRLRRPVPARPRRPAAELGRVRLLSRR